MILLHMYNMTRIEFAVRTFYEAEVVLGVHAVYKPCNESGRIV